MWCFAHAALAILITLYWEVLFSRFLQSRMHLPSQPDPEQPVSGEKQQSYARMQVLEPCHSNSMFEPWQVYSTRASSFALQTVHR